jgi:Amt family ammonium transporter
VASSKDAILSVSVDGLITSWNHGAEEMFGYPAASAIGREMSMLVPPEGSQGQRGRLERVLAGESFTAEVTRVRSDGSEFPASVTTGALLGDDGQIVGVSAIIRDISVQKRLEAELTHLAFHDTLTDLANRTLFNDRLTLALAQRPSSPERGPGLIMLDLDDFKAINDSLGHEAGDGLLVSVAGSLRMEARVGDTVARLGGDEFALLLPDVSLGEALKVADRLVGRLRLPVQLGPRLVVPVTSMGVVVSQGEDAEMLLKRADIAMYLAKRKRLGGYEVFDPVAHDEVLARHALEIDLRSAADAGELFLDYQPILALSSHEMVGVEALVRWQHPTRGRLQPMEFIPLAEQSGSIRQIGLWVLRQAARQAREWDALHPDHPGLRIAVNLSPAQLLDPDLVPQVRMVLADVGIAPSRVTLEVTETALGGDTESMIQKLERLRALGVNLAIDDFGTGYSSLSFLRRLPITQLKIDRSFVEGIAREPEEWALTTAIIRLAKSLGKRTLAEGIETGGQLAHLRALKCDYGQGYLFSAPLVTGMDIHLDGRFGPQEQRVGPRHVSHRGIGRGRRARAHRLRPVDAVRGVPSLHGGGGQGRAAQRHPHPLEDEHRRCQA